MTKDSLTSENQLLARLPEAVLKHLRPHLSAVALDSGLVLYEAHSPIEMTYFPDSGTLSAVVVMTDGSMIEVATVGWEGAVGLPGLDAPSISINRIFVQVAGNGRRISTAVLTNAIKEFGPIRQLFNQYITAFQFQVSQSVACNGLHPLQQRACRWLLMTHDRVQGNEISLTHEFLANMLGVRRSSVTEVLQSLKDLGWIDYTRGRIIIVDRERLEGGTCECYRTVKDEYIRLLN